MRAITKVLPCIALIVFCEGLCTTATQAATYTATPVDAATVLRNNNGALVKVTATPGPVSEDSTSTVTVTIGDHVLATYNSPVGTIDHITAINDAEVLVGYRVGVNSFHAFLFKDGVASDLHAAIASALGIESPSAYVSSQAKDINKSGTIVGYITGETTKAFEYKNGVVTDLGAVAGVPITSATSINNFGQIAATSPNQFRPLIYSNGAVQTLTYSDPTFGARPITPVKINDAGQVTGVIQLPGTSPPPPQHPTDRFHLFLFEGGTIKDISGSFQENFLPNAMNNSGAIVGSSIYSSGAILYKGGLTLDLTDETDAASRQNLQIYRARSINNDGVILADNMLLTPISTPPIDPAVFNFEAGAQGWVSNGEPIITISPSTAQKFAGNSSLAINFNAAGFASVRVLDSVAPTGQTITFHVYVPMNANIDWIQPFAQGGADDNWGWHGNWMPANNLQQGAWNTVTVQIPGGGISLSSIGLELYASQAGTGTIYLDSVDFSAGSTTSTPDTAQYNFEASTQGWANYGDSIATLSTSTTQKFAGNSSLAIAINGTGTASIAVPNPAAHAGQTVNFHVYIPGDAHIASIQAFAMEGTSGGWAWHGNWQPIEALQLGAWNTVSVTIPAGAQALQYLGVELSTSQSYVGTVYIDSVSF